MRIGGVLVRRLIVKAHRTRSGIGEDDEGRQAASRIHWESLVIALR